MDPFLGEIKMFGGTYAPYGWAFCQGQLLPIAQNQALYSLLGTYYGGDGITNFALPDLRGRVPMGFGNGPGLTPRSLAQKVGQESVTLAQTQMPQHTHAVNAVAGGGDQASPQGNYPAIESTGTSRNYSAGPPNATMNANTVASSGTTPTPVPMVQPSQVINFIIALEGIYPPRE